MGQCGGISASQSKIEVKIKESMISYLIILIYTKLKLLKRVGDYHQKHCIIQLIIIIVRTFFI